MVHHLEVADLVLDHIVEHLRWSEQKAPVERHRAGGRAPHPAGALAADGEPGVGGPDAGDGGVEPRDELGAGGAPVPALERLGTAGLRYEQEVATAVHARAPGLGQQPAARPPGTAPCRERARPPLPPARARAPAPLDPRRELAHRLVGRARGGAPRQASHELRRRSPRSPARAERAASAAGCTPSPLA